MNILNYQFGQLGQLQLLYQLRRILGVAANLWLIFLKVWDLE